MEVTFMIKLSSKQVDQWIDQLPLREKMRLVQKLEQETLKQRWNGILKDIDKRLKQFPISTNDIAQEIKAYRQRQHA